MPEVPALTETFIELQSWMRENAPGVIFRSPASPAAIANFAEKSGLDLPDELGQLLLLADGETPKSAGAIGNWRIMPIAEIQAAWGFLTQLTAKRYFIELIPETSPYLRAAWWHPGWIPIVTDDAGGYFCLDTDPPEPTRSGQVILFLREQPARPLVAASLSAWFDRITRDLAAGIYTFNETKIFNCEAFLWSSLEHKHLFDGVDGKRLVDDVD